MSSLVLFYSQQCQHSKSIMMTLQKSSLQNNIKMFCIDGFQPLPKYLTHVPTLKNYANNQILVGEQILEWLSQYKEEKPDVIEDQMAYSTGGYTMLDQGQNDNVNEIDDVYNARISTPQGQMPTKEGNISTSSNGFPRAERMQSGGLDMAMEKMMQEREAQFPTQPRQNMEASFDEMMQQRNNQVTI